jgi:hypothetical protein
LPTSSASLAGTVERDAMMCSHSALVNASGVEWTDSKVVSFSGKGFDSD